MTNYIIEGNINFYDELYKSLDDEDDANNTNLCQITGMPLTNNSVTLECNHKFNYEAIYKEICRQKYVFKTYDTRQLSKPNLKKFLNSKLDYYIKCPYCRDIQFTILPYYKELGLEQKYGINSLDKQHSYNPIYNNSNLYSDTGCCVVYGLLFENNKPPCNIVYPGGTKCNNKYTTFLPGTEVSYCFNHYKKGLRDFKLAEKKKKQDEKNVSILEKKKLLEDTNAERASKGLAPLTRLVKKKIANVVESINTVDIYNPNTDDTNEGCQAILKSGANKGSKCGCKKIHSDGLCKRHSVNKNITPDSNNFESNKSNSEPIV